jgi:transposase InsO family protein
MENTRVSLRLEFVTLALAGDANVSQLCRRFGISRKTGYKWLESFLNDGADGLMDRSRKPLHSPRKTPGAMEQAVLEIRAKHPSWGGRKIKKRLLEMEASEVPAPSTITEILRRHGKLNLEESRKHQPWRRFEADAPNDLWQMDFKGHFPLNRGGRCHPLTILDDNSRFAIGLRACGNERGKTVKDELTTIFRRYGMPGRFLVDNGTPWGSGNGIPYTSLTTWLIRLGIAISHSSPYHPQTLGKDERFHRTIQVELLQGRQFNDLEHAQQYFDPWRDMYNFERPHEALDMCVPGSCYRESPRSFPEALPLIEYGPGDIVRKVQDKGIVHFRGRVFTIPTALHGYPIAKRPRSNDGIYDIYFCHQKVTEIDIQDMKLDV